MSTTPAGATGLRPGHPTCYQQKGFTIMRLFHPIRTWREMRTRSKAIAGGIGGLLIVPLVAFAAAILMASSPFQGNVHNGAWSISLSPNTGAQSLVADSSTNPPASWNMPTDATQAVRDALGDPTTYMPLDTDGHFACSGVTYSAGDTTHAPSFTIADGSGALPGDTCYINLTFQTPKNAADVYVSGLTATSLPKGWVMMIDGTGGQGPSECSAPGGPFIPAGAAATQTLKVMLIAGNGIDLANNAPQPVSGTVNFEGGRGVNPPADLNPANCYAVGQ